MNTTKYSTEMNTARYPRKTIETSLKLKDVGMVVPKINPSGAQ